MSAIVKMEKTFDCLMCFKNNCNDEEYKKLIDIFFPMLYQDNRCRFEICVGKNISKFKFNSFLTTTLKRFMIKLSCHNNEPQIIIEDRTTNVPKVAVVINLTAIKNLHVETESKEDQDFYKHNIIFNYNDVIDYKMCIIITKE